MGSSWANILVFKIRGIKFVNPRIIKHGLPTLVNKDIEIKNFGESIIQTELEVESIKNNILNISRWNEKERILKENKIISIVKEKTSFDKISQEYSILYDDIKAVDSEIIYEQESIDDVKSKIEIFFLLFRKNLNFFLMSTNICLT